MRRPNTQLNLFNANAREIIVDNFAGGGGASTGIELAIGRSVDVAINHDPEAIAMHKVNHPTTEHYCESVWDVDPRKAADGRPVALCWLSPDCKHFSKAKGGKPVSKHIRGLAWIAVRWAATVRPRVIILENVEEFQTWGPLLHDGRPDPKQRGREFNAFVNALTRQGYEVDWRELRACDYGAPTIRKRLFLIARRDGQPIVWPSPTHGHPKSPAVKAGKMRPWRTASEVIDWSLPCPSIFERERPLAENTLRRIAKGMFKFVLEDPDPFVINLSDYKSGERLTIPHITKFQQNSIGQRPDEPLHTVMAGATRFAMVSAWLAQYHTETAQGEVRGQALTEPIMTLDTSNRYGLVTSHLIKMYSSNIGQRVTEPLHTVTAGGNHLGEVRAFLTQYNGSSIGQRLDAPLNTISTHDRFGLVTVHGQDYAIVDIGMRMLEPHELFPAQGFPSEYVIDHDADGKKYSKKAQVARCGNAVPPPFATHLVRANLPELCAKVKRPRKAAN